MRFLFLLGLLVAPSAFAAETPQTIEDNVSFSDQAVVNVGLDVQYLPVSYRNHTWVGDQRTDSTGHGIHLGVEWIPFDERYGKLGVGLGTGFYTIRNVGFGDTKATLTTVPVETFLSYRFDYIQNQILVPFVKLGLSHTFSFQRGINVPGHRGYWGWDRGAGVELCLNKVDKIAASSLRRGFGIDNSYLIFEYVKSEYLGQRTDPDLTHEEFRLGFRFEI